MKNLFYKESKNLRHCVGMKLSENGGLVSILDYIIYLDFFFSFFLLLGIFFKGQ